MAAKGFDLNVEAFEADDGCGSSNGIGSGGIGNGGSGVLGEIGGDLGVSHQVDHVYNESGINLVVDLGSCFKDCESKEVMADLGETSNAVGSAKEGEFRELDLVWGKLRGYPWWPGQVVDPSLASAKAKRNKEGYLVAYFGDETFIWSEVSKMKAFETHFSEMSKQSSDAAFCQAVNAALDEHSRRIQAGLACPCLLEDAPGRVKLNGSTHVHAAFQPRELVAYVQSLAKGQAGCDDLKLVTAKAHLASFYRSKGYNELTRIEDFVLREEDSGVSLNASVHESLKEDELAQMIDVEVDSGDDYIAAYGKRKSPSTDLDQPESLGGLKKPRLDSHVEKPDEPLGEAEKSQLDSQSGSSSIYQSGENKHEGPAYSVPARRGRGRPRKAVVEKADVISGSSPSFPNGQKESEVKSASPKEPACSVPVPKSRGRPRKVVESADPSMGETKIPEETVKETEVAESEETVKADFISGSSPSFPNGQKESEVKSASPKEPACSMPVPKSRGRPRKVVESADPSLGEAKIPEETVQETEVVESEETVKADFISGSSPSFPNGQKESGAKSASPKQPTCTVPVHRGRGRPRKVLENADPSGAAKIPEETVKETEVAEPEETVQPVRRGRGRPRKAAVQASESEVSSTTGEKYQEFPPPSELLSKLRAAAASPMEGGYEILTPVAGFLGSFRNSACLKKAKEVEREAQAAKEAADKEANEAYEEFKKTLAAKEAAEGYCPTGLIFKFSSLDSLPSVERLNEIYGRFGPLEESETRLLHKCNRLVFVFKRKCDAERAFSASGKYAIFGPALDSYMLDYEPSTSKSCSAKRRKRK